MSDTRPEVTDVPPEVLKGWPFCGYTARIVRARPTDPAMVTCNGPDCILHNAFFDEADAIKAWNRRIEAPSPERERAHALLDALIEAEAKCRPLRDVWEEAAPGYSLTWRGSTIALLREVLQAIDGAAEARR